MQTWLAAATRGSSQQLTMHIRWQKDWQKKQVIDRKVSGGDERDLIDWNCQGRGPMTSPPTGRDLLGFWESLDSLHFSPFTINAMTMQCPMTSGNRIVFLSLSSPLSPS